MNTTISAKSATIEPDYTNSKVRVTLNDFDESEIEHLIDDSDSLQDRFQDWLNESDIGWIVESFQANNLLEEIGEEKCIEYFNLTLQPEKGDESI